jgi:hypothetical protein
MNKMNVINLKPGQHCLLRNGATAIVRSADEPGVRPIRAEIIEPGEPLYSRWYCRDGTENVGEEESPYDIMEFIGTVK